MHITFIGSGNVATVFGHRLLAAGHTFFQVMSRQLDHAAELAGVLRASPVDRLSDLRPGADLYIIATRDAAVSEIARDLRLGDALVVHTAGSVPMGVLAQASTQYGVLYPLQSIRRELAEQPMRIPLLIDGVDEGVREHLTTLAAGITDIIRIANDAERLSLHIGGVIVNNFPNYLYTLTEEYLRSKGADFHLLEPLLAETARRLKTLSPSQVQTGPAIRGDKGTIAEHQAHLLGHPELLTWYNLFTARITAYYDVDGSPLKEV
jgi:predicted short-subunit dehydrogenase-like oxidoreductase (DUF2520 family)